MTQSGKFQERRVTWDYWGGPGGSENEQIHLNWITVLEWGQGQQRIYANQLVEDNGY